MYVVSQVLYALIFSRRLERRSGVHFGAVCGLMLLAVLTVYQSAVLKLSSYKDKALSFFPGKYKTAYMVTASVVFCGCVFCLIAFTMCQIFKARLREGLYAATLAYLAEHLVYCIKLLIAFMVPTDITGGAIVYDVVFLIVSGVIFDRTLARKLIYNGHYLERTTDMAGLMASAGVIVMVLSSLSDSLDLRSFHSLYGLCFCAYVLFMQYERQQALIRQEESAIREQMLISQKNQYNTYRDAADIVNRKCHDLKHQLAAIRFIDKGTKQKEAIRQLEDTVLEYDAFVKTGSEALDTILSPKSHTCMEEGIVFTCVCDGKATDFIDPVDLFTLFGNMMDNAIEASLRLEKKERSISLSVVAKTGILLIIEENPSLPPDEQNGRIITSKGDFINHGYGIKSMEMVADKYDGSLRVGYEGGVFSIKAAIPIP